MSISIVKNNALIETELPTICISGVNRELNDISVCINGVLKSCKENDKTITYVSDKGTVPDMEFITEEAIVLPSISDVEGYEFKGWTSTSGSTTVEYNSGSSYIFNESIVLYAVWQAVTYNLYLYKYSSLYATKTAIGGTSIQPGSCSPNTNETFVGWTSINGSTNTQYNSNTNIVMNSNKTLYAIFNVTTYTTKQCYGFLENYNISSFTLIGSMQLSVYYKVINREYLWNSLSLVSRDPASINEASIMINGIYITSWSQVNYYASSPTSVVMKVLYTGDNANYVYLELKLSSTYLRSSL
jgi:hypothetical protein